MKQKMPEKIYVIKTVDEDGDDILIAVECPSHEFCDCFNEETVGVYELTECKTLNIDKKVTLI